MKTKKKLSIWQVRALAKNYEKSELRGQILRLPLSLAHPVVLLQERAASTGLGDDPRWNGVVLAVKHLSTSWAVSNPGANTLKYTRAMCSELARHPGLAPTVDHTMRPLDLDISQLYNALQYYLCALEDVVGKDVDRLKAVS